MLIDNQLERTDHIHLGQLLTYAAGLEAVTIVWVARQFRDEHRAALDWLNNATRPGFDFFGLEIELWKIGDSAMAPKFNVVSKPNDWKEQVAAVPGLTKTQARHLEFWTQLRQYMEDHGGSVRTNKPSKDHWTNVSVGRADFSLVLANNFMQGRSSIHLLMTGPSAKAHFGLIEQHYGSQVETQLAALGALKWRLLPKAKESHIALVREASPADPATWPELNAWMASTVRTMHDLFRPIVKDLDASEWLSPDVEGMDVAAGGGTASG